MKRWRARTAVVTAVFVLLTIAGLRTVYAYLNSPQEVPGAERTSVRIGDAHAVSYFRAGDRGARRIVYVHGSPGSATAWATYLADPMPGYEAIAIDRFGFGGSTPKTPVPSLEEQARAIAPFLVERNGQWPILVGHSFGGAIICQAAVDYPDKVGGIVILAGALAPDLERIHWYQRLADFWILPSLLPADLVTSNRELMPLKGELETLSRRLGEIRCPIAILHGKRDMLVPVANVDFMREKFRGGAIVEVAIFPKENHFLPWTVEAKVRESIAKLAAAQRSR